MSHCGRCFVSSAVCWDPWLSIAVFVIMTSESCHITCLLQSCCSWNTISNGGVSWPTSWGMMSRCVMIDRFSNRTGFATTLYAGLAYDHTVALKSRHTHLERHFLFEVNGYDMVYQLSRLLPLSSSHDERVIQFIQSKKKATDKWVTCYTCNS